jgi:MFS family permease
MGQLADRYGGRVVVFGGAALYALGILGMALSSGLALFTFFAGIVMGIAVSAAGMPVIIASLTRLCRRASGAERRGSARPVPPSGSSWWCRWRASGWRGWDGRRR